MAEVYRAEQELAAGIYRPAALKVIRPEYSESPDFREMFLDEARTACTLSHPNIVHIYEVGEAEGLLYMAMELVPGETLATVNRTLRERGDRFSDEALFAIGIFCCSALEAVHALKAEGGHINLVHRDVSPHNLLLGHSGSLKLIDFGIAKAATNRNLTNPGVTKGKAGYFSPEQAMGKKLDGRSDLFSVGVTIYKLASGVTPFDSHKTHAERNGALVRGQWIPLEKAYPGLPPGLYEVVGKSLKLKPDDRYATAKEMREALERAAFDAGFRISTSSLANYVDDQGEITSTPAGGRTSAATRTALPAPAPPAPAPPGVKRRHHTERMMGAAAPSAKSSRNRWALPLLFASAAVVGGAAVIFAIASSGPDEPAVKEVAPPTPKVAAAVVREPPKEVPVAVAPSEGADSGSELAALEPEVATTITVGPLETHAPQKPTVRPSLVKSKPVAAATPHPAPAVPVPPPKAEEESEIPSGEARLRIATKPQNVAATVFVGNNAWGMAPADGKVNSGRYTVSVQLANGKRSPPWTGAVRPDRVTTLEYLIDEERWTSR